MKTKSRLTWLLAMVFALSFVLAACAGGSDSGDSGSSDDGEQDTDVETVEGGDLVLAVLSDASSLDPAGSNDVPSSVVQANIYETLVKFHDGEDFNAEVVKMNLERILDKDVASPRYFLYEMIESVDVIDEYTVQIKTEYPFAPIYAHLSHNGGSMVSPKSIEEDYKAMKDGKKPGTVVSDHPVGTGYFKFKEWKPGDEIVLERNDDYWGDKAHVDTATFRVVPESTTRNAELERGFVHITDPVEPIEVETINDSDYAKVLQKPSASLSYIGFNTEKEPFDDPKVRQAISMMVNKEEVIDGVYEGFGIPAKGPLAPSIFGYNDDAKPLEYNVEEAKKLLKEAGLEDGFKTTIWTNDSPQRIDTAIILQNSLKEIGIDAK